MLRDEIATIIAGTTEKVFGQDIRAEISYPEPKFGDFATNVAFGLAKELKKAPAEIATELCEAIDDHRVDDKSAINGFINLKMTPEFWIEQLHKISSEFGSTDLGKGRKTQVEFISANPTGPLTIGNARGGFIGDVLSRVLEHTGHRVTREYYFNNAGTQIRKLVESVKVAAGVAKAGDEEVQYGGDYINELAAEFKAELTSKSDSELSELITTKILEKYIKPAVATMGISFDEWFNERDVIDDNTLNQVIEMLKSKGLVFEKDGAVWLDSGKLGVEREARVMIKSNGDPTYLAPDIAYHWDIFSRRGFDAAIKVLGPDHIDQFPSVKAASEAICPGKDLTMASYQWLRVVKDGKEVKVSKRLGQFITIAELIDQVGMPVARFLTLMRSPDSHMDFDLDLAREQSQKNPYYYVMYSYARANSILAEASKRGLSPVDTVTELTGYEMALIRQLSRFPELVSEMAADYGVHRLTFFGLESAKLFHDLYESERIIDLDQAEASKRLYVIRQYITFMQVYWQLLGIEPLERMEHDPA